MSEDSEILGSEGSQDDAVIFPDAASYRFPLIVPASKKRDIISEVTSIFNGVYGTERYLCSDIGKLHYIFTDGRSFADVVRQSEAVSSLEISLGCTETADEKLEVGMGVFLHEDSAARPAYWIFTLPTSLADRATRTNLEDVTRRETWKEDMARYAETSSVRGYGFGGDNHRVERKFHGDTVRDAFAETTALYLFLTCSQGPQVTVPGVGEIGTVAGNFEYPGQEVTLGHCDLGNYT
ncbi:hypothetical protein IAU60_005855 [Kwoniella sp. DSM 27419]